MAIGMAAGLGKEGTPPRRGPLASGVVLGSITALAATPAGEVRTLILGLCQTMPPDAFKVFIVRVASGLAPSVHRVLIARAYGSAAYGTAAIKRLLPRR